jgi:hypothetical protein
MSKNFVDNDNATALMGAVEESIANTRIFKGTFDDYNALTPEEKAKYSYIATPKTPGEAITDAVTDGDMRPVTSNAVYDALQDKVNAEMGTLQTSPTFPITLERPAFVYVGASTQTDRAVLNVKIGPNTFFITSGGGGENNAFMLPKGATINGVANGTVQFAYM